MERTGCFDNTNIITNTEQSMEDKDSVKNLQADIEMRDDMDDGHGDESYGEQEYDTIQDGEQSSPHNESQSYNWNTSIDVEHIAEECNGESEKESGEDDHVDEQQDSEQRNTSGLDPDVPLYPGATIINSFLVINLYNKRKIFVG